VIAVWVYRDMKLKDVPRVLLSSANMSAMILYIITNAVLFSFSASRPAGDDSLDQG
jgi:C4-dicarboxylate transporter, DctM subunit